MIIKNMKQIEKSGFTNFNPKIEISTLKLNRKIEYVNLKNRIESLKLENLKVRNYIEKLN